jgi:hypothetical protein
MASLDKCRGKVPGTGTKAWLDVKTGDTLNDIKERAARELEMEAIY